MNFTHSAESTWVSGIVLICSKASIWLCFLIEIFYEPVFLLEEVERGKPVREPCVLLEVFEVILATDLDVVRPVLLPDGAERVFEVPRPPERFSRLAVPVPKEDVYRFFHPRYVFSRIEFRRINEGVSPS